jgi:hypothetical protein
MQKAHLYEAILLVNRGIDDAVRDWSGSNAPRIQG